MIFKAKYLKAAIFIAALFLLIVNLFVVSYVSASIKDTACAIVGCPNGSRPCADVGVPPLVYHCYENPPQ